MISKISKIDIFSEKIQCVLRLTKGNKNIRETLKYYAKLGKQFGWTSFRIEKDTSDKHVVGSLSEIGKYIEFSFLECHVVKVSRNKTYHASRADVAAMFSYL